MDIDQADKDELVILVTKLRKSAAATLEECDRSRQLIKESQQMIESVSRQLEPDYRG